MIYLLPICSAFCIFCMLVFGTIYQKSKYESVSETLSSLFIGPFAIAALLFTLMTLGEFPQILFGALYLPCILPLFYERILANLNIEINVKQKLRNYLEIEDQDDETN